MFFIFLKHISNFKPVRCYLLFDLSTYFLCIILDFKNSKFKYLIDDLTINLWSYWNFASMKQIRRKCNPIVNFTKFTSNKKYIKWSCSFSLHPSLLPNFVQSLRIMFDYKFSCNLRLQLLLNKLKWLYIFKI